MAGISSSQENGFDKIVLEIGSATAEIIPACGAMLQAFWLRENEAKINVIYSYNSKAEFDESQAEKGFPSAKMSPFVCRLREGKYKHAGKPYSIKKFFLGDHAIHGLLFDAAFSVTNKKEAADHITVEMEFKYEGTDPGYPFHYICSVEYKLTDENRLYITTSIQNNSPEIIPIADGWHPYFSFNKKIDELQLEVQTQTRIEFDEGMIPTGEEKEYDDFTSLKLIGNTRFDDCFRLNFETCQPMVVLRDKENKLQVKIFPEKSYPFLQIYTPENRQSIAIENLSAAPDCFNNGMGLVILEPGDSKSFVTSYQLEKIAM